jgi:hypothetical protein
MLKFQWLQHATHKKEMDMNRFVEEKTGARLLQDRILLFLISGRIALTGIVRFSAAKNATGI